MKIYLVGGAVRDKLLNIKNSSDNDWVVVGGTSEFFLKKGYQQVGKDFPVFLHPKTNEEYALARIERKQGSGHKGFICHATPDVTLEEDLLRRDLTINAMAMDENGTIIDPYNGQKDCKNRILRHVSPAFAEDPLRCLRLARFAAQLTQFVVAEETLCLCKDMVANDALSTLSKTRIWQEWHKALLCSSPEKFLHVLYLIGAIKEDLSHINFNLTTDSRERFALIASNLKDIDYIKNLDPPKKHRKLALVCHAITQSNIPNNAEEWLSIFKKLDAFRQEDMLSSWLIIAQSNNIYNTKQTEKSRKLFSLMQDVSIQQIIDDGYSGQEISIQLDKRRITAIINNLD